MAFAVQITFDCADPRALGLFWAQVLGYAVDPPPGGEVGDPIETADAWLEFLRANDVPEAALNSRFALIDPEGAGPRVFFQQVPEPKAAKNRVHLDVRAAEGLRGDERMAALEAEAERLVQHGATRGRRFDPDGIEIGFIVMADPEGNEFCLD